MPSLEFDGNAACDLYISGTGNTPEITTAQYTDSTAVWQVWNVTHTSSGSTLVRACPQSIDVTATATSATSTEVWTIWNNATASTGTITGTADNVVQLYGPATQVTGDLVWTEWGNQFPNDQVRRSPDAWVRMSREERERWEQREREAETRRAEERARYEAQQAEARAKQAAADERAEKLLLRHLTSEQQAEYKRSKRFYLYTGGKKYRVDKGWQGNVKLVDETDEKVLASYCIHPSLRVPHCDNMLAQKLLLEGSEEEFKRIANESRYN